MNGNTSRRLGKHRRSVVTERRETRSAASKHLLVDHVVTGPGVRGERVLSGKLRREHGKSPMSKPQPRGRSREEGRRGR